MSPSLSLVVAQAQAQLLQVVQKLGQCQEDAASVLQAQQGGHAGCS